MDPFAIDGPALISFSGGRTSAYMLRRCLDAGLAPDVHVVFADTGKERPETYDFVREVSARWRVSIIWVARATPDGVIPFDQLIRDRSYLPNPTMRFCTQELKIRPMKKLMLAFGHEHWTNVIGIRADEPRRVARMRVPNRDRWENALPLAEAGVTVADVDAFWAAQPFDLRLRKWEGNCDLCFLKGTQKRLRIIRDSPELAEWWIAKEREVGAPFRNDTPNFARLVAMQEQQGVLSLGGDGLDDFGDCVCHD